MRGDAGADGKAERREPVVVASDSGTTETERKTVGAGAFWPVAGTMLVTGATSYTGCPTFRNMFTLLVGRGWDGIVFFAVTGPGCCGGLVAPKVTLYPSGGPRKSQNMPV